MKKLLIIFYVITFFSCNQKVEKEGTDSHIRKEILGRNFLDSEIKSIDIVQIDHPMLGGIIKEIKMSEKEKIKFLSGFNSLQKIGLLKCGSKYVVRLNMENDTLRLKVCGAKIANRNNDIYYELEGGKNIISIE